MSDATNPGALTLFSRYVARFFGAGLRVPERGIQPTGPSTSSVTDVPTVVSDEKALTLATVWACVRLIVQTIGMTPFHVYEYRGRRKVLRDDHPIEYLLSNRPNPWQTPVEFRETLALHLCLRGNSYVYIIRGADGQTPVALLPLPSDLVEVEVLPDQSVVYRYSSDKGLLYLSADSILHVRLMGPGRYIGLSPLAYARATMGTAAATEESAARYFINGARPSGIVSFDKLLTKEQRDALRAKLGEMTEGAPNAWKLLVLEGGMKYDTMSLSPEDSQMLETRAFNQLQLCQFFGVPPHLVGITEKVTTWGTGLEQMNLAFLTYNFQPYITRIEAALEGKLFTPEERMNLGVDADLRVLLRADMTARSQFYSTMTQNGIMTRNEARELEGMDESSEANANELTVQSNLTLIKKVGEEPKAPVAVPGRLPGEPATPEEEVAAKMQFHLHVPEVKVQVQPLPITVNVPEAPPVIVNAPPVHVAPPQPQLLEKQVIPNDDGSWTVKEIRQ